MTGVGDQLDQLRERVRAAVAARQQVDPDPGDRFRGLYVSDDQASQLFAGAAASAAGERARLDEVADRFDLDAADVAILLVALAPDYDQRFEKAYGYLHDDVSRRRASVGLALELAGLSTADAAARARLGAGGHLVAGGLVEVDDSERPVLTRSLRVPDVVGQYLLGSDELHPLVQALLGRAVISPDVDAEPLRRAASLGFPLIYVRDRTGAATLSFVATGLDQAGRHALILDLERLDASADVAAVAKAAVRDARLRSATLVVGPVEQLVERGQPAVRAFAEVPAPVVLMGNRVWDPRWSRQLPLELVPPDVTADFEGGLPFRLTPEQATRARAAAEQQASLVGELVTLKHLAFGARAQNASGLEHLAMRISPQAGFDDLVLPESVSQQLRDLVARVRFRARVLGEWRLRRAAGKGRGVTALFSGDSGTGKTLSAEVVAGALGLDLYVIDLATVIDKYIGETEKNLDKIFREADRVNGVLLFDEADAIFGKRSDVRDAHDRYANVEVAYLLQRMERFDGIAVLTTNMHANIDEAFLRRLDALVDFPTPDEPSRRLLWEKHLPSSVPRTEDVDLGFLSKAFDLPGGNIRNISIAAAFLAAAEDRPVAMVDLIRATGREYRKLGRLCIEAEFGPYMSSL